MTVDEPTPPSRQERLEVRRRRQRWAAVLVAALLLGGAATVAAFSFSDDAPATSTSPVVLSAGSTAAPRDASTSTTTPPLNVRPINHDAPLRLWVGGDSLSGTTGLALGQLAGATGVVAPHIDYKVSSGLAPGTRDWPTHAKTAIAQQDPEAVVFMIGTNDANVVDSSDVDNDNVPDWETDYRRRVATMMDLLVGGEKRRTVIWVGAPTLRDEDGDDAVVELNRIMVEEAAKRAPYVMYFDAYAHFADEDGEYTDRVDIPVTSEPKWTPSSRAQSDETESSETEAGETQSVRVRVGDGVHFTEAGAEYIARPLFALLDQRYGITGQADPARPILATLEDGGELGGSTGGGGSNSDDDDDDGDDDGSSNNQGNTPTTRRRTPATTAPASSGDNEDESPAPTSPPATSPPATSPPAPDPPPDDPPSEPPTP